MSSLRPILQYFLKWDTIFDGYELNFYFNLPIPEAQAILRELAEQGIVERSLVNQGVNYGDFAYGVWKLKAPRSEIEKLLLLS